MKNRILIVDDTELNRELLSEILRDEYDILEAEDGEKALEVIDREKDNISAILLDLVMPVKDGFQVLEQLHEDKIMDKIPVLVISGENSTQSEKKCFDYGVSDFIGRPFKAVLVKRRVQNMVNQYIYKNRLEEKVAEQTAVLRKTNEKLKLQTKKLKKTNEEIIDLIGTVVEYRNFESSEHIQRVKGYTKIAAEAFAKMYPEYGLTRKQIEVIVSVSSLHDIGKIAIPDNILLKNGKLTKEEFEIMKQHTVRGCDMLNSMKIEWNDNVRETAYNIIRYHHEKYDGNGYPDGLKGDSIPISAQLVSLADVYDALINERCYKAAFSKEEAFDMITHGECGAFSDKLMNVFHEVREKFEKFASNPIV